MSSASTGLNRSQGLILASVFPQYVLLGDDFSSSKASPLAIIASI